MEIVYIETTILSYLVSRPSRDIIVAARQELTREWWEYSRPGFDCVISQIVLDEIAAGDPEHAGKRLERANTLEALAVNPKCQTLAQAYLNRGYIPKSEIRDALHIAVAVIWKVDYLLTWNCKHIANAHSLRQLRKFSESQGHEFPQVCTPEEL
jgi:hypothetical protein